MMRALRMCFVLFVVCAGCGPVDRPAGDDDPDPTDLNGGGGWEGSNCMGADYGIELLDDSGNVVSVRQSTAIGVVVDSLGLAASTNEDGGVEVQLVGLDRFLAVGLRNWMHKMGETLLPDEDWIASYDPDNDEYGRGHYNLLGLTSVCDPIGESLDPAVARTLSMFLFALSQMASCPDPEVAEEDGNFVAVPVRLQATEHLAQQLPSPPPVPTLSQLYLSSAVHVIPEGAAPSPTMTCVLWDQDDDDTLNSNKPAPDPRCLLEARVESMVTTVERSEAPFDDGPDGPAGEPVAFAAKPVLAVSNALGQATPVRHLLGDYHVGVITRIDSYTTCDDDSYARFGAAIDPCPASMTRLHFRGADVVHREDELPIELEGELDTIFTRGSIEDAIIIFIPFDAQPRCMYECPPESPRPDVEDGVACS
jgi:hypothetical protein